MNTKIILPTGKLIAVGIGLTLASPAFGSDFDQNEKTEEIRKCIPKITDDRIESDDDAQEIDLLEAIRRAGGFKRLSPRKDQRPVSPEFPTDGSTMLATSSGDQPNSANKTRKRTA